MKTVDNIGENFVSNSWAFNVPSTSGAGAVLTPILKAFYDSYRQYLSPLLAQNGHIIKYSELPGVKPNYPFDEDTWNLTAAPSGTAIPDELAVCLSFQGARAAGAPQSRRRGRIYMGPHNTAALTANRPLTALQTNLANYALTLKNAVTAAGAGFEWGIWSNADSHLVVVTNGWVDNAWDVQRRRGVDATTRTVW